MKLKDIVKSEAAAIVASAALLFGPFIGYTGHSVYRYATSDKISNSSARVVFYPEGNIFKNYHDDFSSSIDRDRDGILDERTTFVHGQKCVSFIHRQAPFERDQKEYASLLESK